MFRVRVVTTSSQVNGVLSNEEEKGNVVPSEKLFITGNPQIENITGKLHLYRPNDIMNQIEGEEGKSSDRGTLLGILSVPLHLSPTELLEFAGAFRKQIVLVRILRDTHPQQYMALIQFCDTQSSDQFYLAFNGKPFNSMEEARCNIVFVDAVEFDHYTDESIVQASSSSSSASSSASTTSSTANTNTNINTANTTTNTTNTPTTTTTCGLGKSTSSLNLTKVASCSSSSLTKSCSSLSLSDSVSSFVSTRTLTVNGTPALPCIYPIPPAGMTEIPTCAVCLDRLDASASGILTTSCNHTFHCDCLFRWEGSSCPVCRYSQGDIESACEMCGTTSQLWICLICGHIGCGRYTGEHAKRHYQETFHAYSLEIETQRVWDYAGDGYVHRLILNKQDGKFVECASPSIGPNGERSQIPPKTDAEEEYQDHQKLEKLAMEYNFLLTSQLEEQRKYYENRLTEAHGTKTHATETHGTETHGTEQRRVLLHLEREKRSLEQKNASISTKLKEVGHELKFVKELNQSLIANQQHWKDRVAASEKLVHEMKEESDKRIGELESQVRDLMFYLDAQTKVSNSVDKEELEEGRVIVQESKPQEVITPGRRKSVKKKKTKT